MNKNAVNCDGLVLGGGTNSIYEKLYQDLLKNRIIYINDDIDDYCFDTVVVPILKMNEDEKDTPVEELKPITLWINTSGGSADVCVAIVSAIENSRIPIHARVIGRACSAGLYITIACKHRMAQKDAMFLLHKGSIRFDGNTGEAEEMMDFYQKEVQKRFDDLIIRRTKLTEKDLKKIRRNETYVMSLDAKEKFGFIDEIL
jgi:ATP-dependent Clp protease protease subunit